MSEVRALMAMSALPLRNSSARVVVSGTTIKRTFGEMRFFAPVVVIAREHNFFVLLRADETERPRADGLAADLVAAAVGNDAHGAVGEVPQQRGEWFLEMEDDGVVIGRVDAVHESVNRCLRAAHLSLQQGVEGPLHVASGQGAAVVKLHAMVQVEDIGQRIGNVPALGQAGGDIEVVAAGQQVVEDEVVDALRLRVQTDARIEVGGAALDDHHQGVGVGFAGAGESEGEHAGDSESLSVLRQARTNSRSLDSFRRASAPSPSLGMTGFLWYGSRIRDLSQDRRPPGSGGGGNIGWAMVPGFVRHEREGGGFLGCGGQSEFVGSADS